MNKFVKVLIYLFKLFLKENKAIRVLDMKEKVVGVATLKHQQAVFFPCSVIHKTANIY